MLLPINLELGANLGKAHIHSLWMWIHLPTMRASSHQRWKKKASISQMYPRLKESWRTGTQNSRGLFQTAHAPWEILELPSYQPHVSKIKNHCRVMSDVPDGCQFHPAEAANKLRIAKFSSRLTTKGSLLLSRQLCTSIPLGIPVETALASLLKTASGKDN